jgi:SAM-dependent methyltransferase
MNTLSQFDTLIQAALSQEFIGWDFSWLNARTRETALPWDYRAIVRQRMHTAAALLDIGTGGGEVLASLAPLPPDTWATETYPPSAAVARIRLGPLGAQVVEVADSSQQLPFPDARFDLLIDRHAGFAAREVYRVLRPGGRFITQQVGGQNCMDLNRFFQEVPYFIYADTTLARDVRQLEEAGFHTLDQREAFPTLTFLDIGGLVFHLKVISFQIEDFSVEKYREKLYQIHQIIARDGGYSVKEHRYWIEAEK